MNETVTIALHYYDELVRAHERLETLARFLSKNDYICKGDIRAILDIEESEESEGKDE